MPPSRTRCCWKWSSVCGLKRPKFTTRKRSRLPPPLRAGWGLWSRQEIVRHPTVRFVPPESPIGIVRAAIDVHRGAIVHAANDGAVETGLISHVGAVAWHVDGGVMADQRTQLAR